LKVDAGLYTIKFVIRSSWRARYAPFHAENKVVLPFDDTKPLALAGTTTPKFTIVREVENVTHQGLKLQITGQSDLPYLFGGDWVEGYTEIQHTFTTKGPHRAIFEGCCRMNMVGGKGNYAQEVSVDLNGVDFSPMIPVVPCAFLARGDAVSFPTVHPKNVIDPIVSSTVAKYNNTIASYKWTLLRTVILDDTGTVMSQALPAGVSLDSRTGVLAVSQGAVSGLFHVELEVSIDGTDSASAVIQTLNITATAAVRPTVEMALPAASAVNDGTRDQKIEFRTGFKVGVVLPFYPSGQGTTLYVQGFEGLMRGDLNFADSIKTEVTQDRRALNIVWDKPCWQQRQSRHIVACGVISEINSTAVNSTSTAAYVRYSVPLCIHVRVIEDEAPRFVEPQENEEMAWFMGRSSSFMIKVQDAALDDTVSILEVSASTPLPTGMVLSPPVLDGNKAQRQCTWEPPPSSGGLQIKICFEAADTPGVSYEHCRLGRRVNVRCVLVTVKRCRYIVRKRESLNDVASHFMTDWVQLWALNPHLTRPDAQVGYSPDSSELGANITTGHLYTVDRGDFLSAVAYKFGTSVKMMLHLNADLVGSNQEDMLPVGKTLCIIPNSCLHD
jgi:hypothetical protein